MPIYDYHCDKCDKTFELLVKSSSTPSCPECQGSMEKLVSSTAAIGKTAGIISSARAQAMKEGHFSNYSRAEQQRIKSK